MISRWIAESGFDRRPEPATMDRRRAAWLLEITVFTIPWQGALTVGNSRITQLIGISSVVVAMCVLLLRGVRRWPTEVHWGFIAWTFLVAASWFWTIAPDLAVVRIATVVQLLALVLLMWEFSADEGQARRFVVAFVLGAVVAIGLALQDFLTAADSAANFARFSAGDSANPNDLGVTTALSLPLAWYLALTTATLRRRLALLVYLPVGLLGVVLTASRSGLVVAGLVLGACALSSINVLGLQRVVVGLLLVPVLGGAIMVAAPEKAVGRLATISDEVDGQGTLSERETLWPAGIDVWRESPVLGVGIGGSRFGIEARTSRLAGAHNSFISVAAELGTVGLGIVVVTLGLILLRINRRQGFERRIGNVLMLGVFVAMLPLHWEYAKTLWVMFAFLQTGFDDAPVHPASLVGRAIAARDRIARQAGARRALLPRQPVA